jgi:hypothetical protein
MRFTQRRFFILKKVCQDQIYLHDLEDIAHLVLEIYIMKVTKNIFYSLEMAAHEAVETKNYMSQRWSPLDDLSYPSSQQEAQRDLDTIYVLAHLSLTFQEKYVFCCILNDATHEQIASDLKIEIKDLERIRASLIGKLQHAATSTVKSGKKQKKRKKAHFIGKIKPRSPQIN